MAELLNQAAALRILVVDDLLDAAESMAALLQAMDQQPFCAYDGQQAVEAAERIRPHLILMDLNMPVMGGLQAAHQIRQLKLDTLPCIVALTGADGAAEVPSDFDAFFRKPMDVGLLSQLIDTLSGKRGA